MAIVQSSLADEILSRQERAVIRGIYRAAQLHEALVALAKVKESATSSRSPIGTKPEVVASFYNAEAYLTDAMCTALVSTKIPAVQSKKNSSQQTIAEQ